MRRLVWDTGEGACAEHPKASKRTKAERWSQADDEKDTWKYLVVSTIGKDDYLTRRVGVEHANSGEKRVLERFRSAIAQFEGQKWHRNELKGFVAGGKGVSTTRALQVVPRADVTCAAQMAGDADEDPIATGTLCRDALDDVPELEEGVGCSLGGT